MDSVLNFNLGLRSLSILDPVNLIHLISNQPSQRPKVLLGIQIQDSGFSRTSRHLVFLFRRRSWEPRFSFTQNRYTPSSCLSRRMPSTKLLVNIPDFVFTIHVLDLSLCPNSFQAEISIVYCLPHASDTV